MPGFLLLETRDRFLLEDGSGTLLLDQTTYADIVLADAPDGYWRLGEPSGTIAFNSEGTVYGTYNAGPTLGAVGALIDDANTAVTFTAASSQFVDIGDIGSGYGNGPFSYECWFKTTGTGANFCMMSLDAVSGAAGNIGFGLGYNANGKVTVVDGTNRIVSSAAATYNDGTFHHCVMTKIVAGNVWKIYIDGADVTTADSLPNTATTSGAFTRNRIACDNNSGTQRFFFTGTIDEAAIYPTALTIDQVVNHYNYGLAAFTFRAVDRANLQAVARPAVF